MNLLMGNPWKFKLIFDIFFEVLSKIKIFLVFGSIPVIKLLLGSSPSICCSSFNLEFSLYLLIFFLLK